MRCIIMLREGHNQMMEQVMPGQESQVFTFQQSDTYLSFLSGRVWTLSWPCVIIRGINT